MILAAVCTLVSLSAVSLPAVHGRAVSLVASSAPWVRCGAVRCEVAKSASAKRRARRKAWYKANKGAEAPRQGGAREPTSSSSPPPPPARYSLDALLRIAEDGRQHPAASDLQAGDRVMVTAVSSSSLGLSVETVACRRPGLVFADEAAYPPGGSFGSDPVEVGDTVPAYVLKVRPDSRLDVCFRPVDPVRRLHEAAAAVLAALVDAAARGEPLPLGDDSEPRAVRRQFPGLSKSGFKAAVGHLLKEGLLDAPLQPHSTALAPDLDAAALAWPAHLPPPRARPRVLLAGLPNPDPNPNPNPNLNPNPNPNPNPNSNPNPNPNPNPNQVLMLALKGEGPMKIEIILP